MQSTSYTFFFQILIALQSKEIRNVHTRTEPYYVESQKICWKNHQ